MKAETVTKFVARSSASHFTLPSIDQDPFNKLLDLLILTKEPLSHNEIERYEEAIELFVKNTSLGWSSFQGNTEKITKEVS